MAAKKKKAKRKRISKKTPVRRRRPAARRGRGSSSLQLTLRVAEQMAAVVRRGLVSALRMLPARGATAAAKEKLKEAAAAFRRQAEAFREQAQMFEARGAEGPAAVWRTLSGRIDHTAAEIRRRLAR